MKRGKRRKAEALDEQILKRYFAEYGLAGYDCSWMGLVASLVRDRRKAKADWDRAVELLWSVYNDIENHHLNDFKLSKHYVGDVKIRRSVGDNIFGFLHSRSPEFTDIVVRRQNRWRRRNNKCAS